MKLLLILLIFLLIIPFTLAEEDEDSGILGSIISNLIDGIKDLIFKIINAPVQLLVNLVKSILGAVVDINLFKSLWAIIIYTLSLFYSLLLLYSGINFMISGYDVIKREKAKEWLKNIVLIVVLVQGSSPSFTKIMGRFIKELFLIKLK